MWAQKQKHPSPSPPVSLRGAPELEGEAAWTEIVADDPLGKFQSSTGQAPATSMRTRANSTKTTSFCHLQCINTSRLTRLPRRAISGMWLSFPRDLFNAAKAIQKLLGSSERRLVHLVKALQQPKPDPEFIVQGVRIVTHHVKTAALCRPSRSKRAD